MIDKPQQKNQYGSLVGLGAFSTFVCVNILNKYLFSTTAMNTWHIAYWRGLSMFLTNIAVCYFNGITILDVKKEFSFFLFIRCILGGFALILNTLQYSLLSLSKGQAIYYTYPIWTAINGYLVLGESITKFDFIGIFTAFSGVLLLIFNKQDTHTSAFLKESPWGIPVALLSAYTISIGEVYSRKIGNNISCYITPAYLGLALTIETSIVLIFIDPSQEAILSYNPHVIFILACICILSWTSYILLTKAYQLEKAARVSVLSYIQIVYSTSIDVIFFGNRLKFIDIFGIILIVSGNFFVLIFNLTFFILYIKNIYNLQHFYH